jgi:hypothetical protein
VGLIQRRGQSAGIVRPGRAGSNTAADHIEVLDAALAQIPDEHRNGQPVLVRTDTAGCTQAFLAYIRSLREYGVDVRFSVSAPIDEPIRQCRPARHSFRSRTGTHRSAAIPPGH